MAKANLESLDALHGALAAYLGDILREAQENKEELPNGTLNAVITFLKNNNITADIVESEGLQNISTKLRDLISEEA